MSYKELVPDAGILIEGLRDTGYDINTALADIVDNSIDAGATRIDVKIFQKVSNNELEVIISDNGCGMSESELEDGMRYGSTETRKKSKERLGKFGLGLKTASTAFCRRLSVVSKSESSPCFNMAIWDLDEVAKKNKWDVELKNENNIETNYLQWARRIAKEGHGTVVFWEKVDRLQLGTKNAKNITNKISEDFAQYASMIYNRFLDSEFKDARTVIMTVNDKTLNAWDPFCRKEPKTEFLSEGQQNCEIINEDGTKSTAAFNLRAYAIPAKTDYQSTSAREDARLKNSNQGYYVYRENRMISYADWLGTRDKEPHMSLCRFEFSFDHELDAAFQVDVKKSRIILNPDLEAWLKEWQAPLIKIGEDKYRQKKLEDYTKGAPDYHTTSDKNIQENGDAKSPVKVRVVEQKGDGMANVEIKGPDIPTAIRTIIIPKEETPGCTVLLQNDLKNGVLWTPTVKDQKKAVLLNTSHPFYEKIYVHNHTDNGTVSGLDALFWTLSLSELSSMYDEECAKMMRRLRKDVSFRLEELLEDIDE